MKRKRPQNTDDPSTDPGTSSSKHKRTTRSKAENSPNPLVEKPEDVNNNSDGEEAPPTDPVDEAEAASSKQKGAKKGIKPKNKRARSQSLSVLKTEDQNNNSDDDFQIPTQQKSRKAAKRKLPEPDEPQSQPPVKSTRKENYTEKEEQYAARYCQRKLGPIRIETVENTDDEDVVTICSGDLNDDGVIHKRSGLYSFINKNRYKGKKLMENPLKDIDSVEHIQDLKIKSLKRELKDKDANMVKMSNTILQMSKMIQDKSKDFNIERIRSAELEVKLIDPENTMNLFQPVLSMEKYSLSDQQTLDALNFALNEDKIMEDKEEEVMNEVIDLSEYDNSEDADNVVNMSFSSQEETNHWSDNIADILDDVEEEEPTSKSGHKQKQKKVTNKSSSKKDTKSHILPKSQILPSKKSKKNKISNVDDVVSDVQLSDAPPGDLDVHIDSRFDIYDDNLESPGGVEELADSFQFTDSKGNEPVSVVNSVVADVINSMFVDEPGSIANSIVEDVLYSMFPVKPEELIDSILTDILMNIEKNNSSTPSNTDLSLQSVEDLLSPVLGDKFHHELSVSDSSFDQIVSETSCVVKKDSTSFKVTTKPKKVTKPSRKHPKAKDPIHISPEGSKRKKNEKKSITSSKAAAKTKSTSSKGESKPKPTASKTTAKSSEPSSKVKSKVKPAVGTSKTSEKPQSEKKSSKGKAKADRLIVDLFGKRLEAKKKKEEENKAKGKEVQFPKADFSSFKKIPKKPKEPVATEDSSVTPEKKNPKKYVTFDMFGDSLPSTSGVKKTSKSQKILTDKKKPSQKSATEKSREKQVESTQAKDESSTSSENLLKMILTGTCKFCEAQLPCQCQNNDN